MSLAIRAQQDERMDDPTLDAATYAAVLRDLARVNGMTMAPRATLAFLGRAIGDRRALRLLDVGFGDGDMLRRIARWARQRGIAADLVGVDLNPRSAAIARADTPPELGVDYRMGDYADLAGDGWDFVVSSLVAHHMSHAQLVAFLRFMDAESRIGWFINDRHRHGFAHFGFPLLAKIMRWHEIVKADGTLSIARSYRPDEWPPILAEAGIAGAVVSRNFPFRLCVTKIR
jgi:2-polyprenyl-3-methyl-5-hydroxy-6-metoxy-1,4-benzoquinol methylase